jgi:hypothetical protein
MTTPPYSSLSELSSSPRRCTKCLCHLGSTTTSVSATLASASTLARSSFCAAATASLRPITVMVAWSASERSGNTTRADVSLRNASMLAPRRPAVRQRVGEWVSRVSGKASGRERTPSTHYAFFGSTDCRSTMARWRKNNTSGQLIYEFCASTLPLPNLTQGKEGHVWG